MSSIYGGLNTYATFALDLTCSPPPSLGGLGYCGPSFCSKATSSMPTCVFTSTARNYASEVAKNTCRTCTQSTDARCTTAALKALVYGQGIKAAFCNDKFLVISTGTSFPVAEIQHEQMTRYFYNPPSSSLRSDMTSGFSNWLQNVPNPPGSVDSAGAACVTRGTNPSFTTYKIPLNPTALSTSSGTTNNIANGGFTAGGDCNTCFLTSTGTSTTTGATSYALPTRGAVGVRYALLYGRMSQQLPSAFPLL